MLLLKQEQDQQAILKKWILKILPDRNCSTNSFTKSSESTGSRKKSNQPGKSSQQYLSIWLSNRHSRSHPLRAGSPRITQMACGLHSSLWEQSQGALQEHLAESCTPEESMGQGCSGAAARHSVSALPLWHISGWDRTKPGKRVCSPKASPHKVLSCHLFQLTHKCTHTHPQAPLTVA